MDYLAHKIRKLRVDKERLGNLLVLMAKEDGVLIFQAEPDFETPFCYSGYYLVYYEAEDYAFKLLRLHCDNSVCYGHVSWDLENETDSKVNV